MEQTERELACDSDCYVGSIAMFDGGLCRVLGASMSKPCTYCGGTGQTKVCTNVIDLTIMRVTSVSTQVPCPECLGKGHILTEPVEIVEDLLQKMRVKQ